jgi:hypothetical protein
MLTAAHCVHWTSDNQFGWLKFTPSYYGEDESPLFGVAWATKIYYWEKLDGSDGLSYQEIAFDYVIVVLDRNIGDLTGYAGYKTLQSIVEQPQSLAEHRISQRTNIRRTASVYIRWCHHVCQIQNWFEQWPNR